MAEALKPRKTPCASCPYRKNVASGVWAEEEYQKLIDYDAETWGQPMAVFMCHQQDGCLCSGWVAHNDPTQLLALRLAAASGRVDESTFDYTTDVPLFESGELAAAHGRKDIERPAVKARKTIDKLTRARDLRNDE